MKEKEMWVVMRVRNVLDDDYGDFVTPEYSTERTERVLKSRVIYADSLSVIEGSDQMPPVDARYFAFHGVSSTPEPDDEWEEWIREMPIEDANLSHWRDALQKWLRKMPRREKP